MRVLLTGGSGFIGTSVLKTLRERGHIVRCALRRPPTSGSDDLSFIVGELGPDADWGRALNGVDAVVHLAGLAHVMNVREGLPSEYHRINVEATRSLARAAKDAGVSRFIFMSTIKVNGEFTSDSPFTPNDKPNPTDLYSSSKLEAERILFGMPSIGPVIIRPPLVYGPGVKGNLLRMCKLVRSRVPLPFGSIQNRRDLVHVQNVADLVNTALSHEQAPGKVFLVSDGAPVSTPQLVSAIALEMGVRARMFAAPGWALRGAFGAVGLRAEYERLSQSLELDIRGTKATLGWDPVIGLKQGVSDMVASLVGRTGQ
jgi:nucleoside-diphosphate-sugar epimerase